MGGGASLALSGLSRKRKVKLLLTSGVVTSGDAPSGVVTYQ